MRVVASTSGGEPADPTAGREGAEVYRHPTARHPEPDQPGPPQDSGDLDEAIATLRSRIDEEFRIAERLDTKARQAFALAAGYFAVIQTVAFGSFGRSDFTSIETGLLIGSTAIAAALLCWTATRLLGSEGPRREIDIDPDAVVEWANQGVGEPQYVRVHLIGKLAKIAKNRTDSNSARVRKISRVQKAAFFSLAMTSLELLVSLLIRIT